jgi:hypothetical protein
MLVRSFVLIALACVIVLVAAMTMGCKPKDADTGTVTPPPVKKATTPEPPKEPAKQETKAPEGSVSQDLLANAIEAIELAAIPIYEGAAAKSAEDAGDGMIAATFTTEDSYAKVKEFYSGKLGTAPPGDAAKVEWTFNSMEMGAIGGNSAEWKASKGGSVVTVSGDANDKPATIKITIKPAGAKPAGEEAAAGEAAAEPGAADKPAAEPKDAPKGEAKDKAPE